MTARPTVSVRERSPATVAAWLQSGNNHNDTVTAKQVSKRDMEPSGDVNAYTANGIELSLYRTVMGKDGFYVVPIIGVASDGHASLRPSCKIGIFCCVKSPIPLIKKHIAAA
jgi:hypothetical protein